MQDRREYTMDANDHQEKESGSYYLRDDCALSHEVAKGFDHKVKSEH